MLNKKIEKITPNYHYEPKSKYLIFLFETKTQVKEQETSFHQIPKLKQFTAAKFKVGGFNRVLPDWEMHLCSSSIEAYIRRNEKKRTR